MVFARISNWKFKEGKREEGLKTLESGNIEDIARSTKGYVGSLTLLDDDNPDAGVIITLWDSEKALNESRKKLFQDAINEIDRFIVNPPDIKNFKLDSLELFM